MAKKGYSKEGNLFETENADGIFRTLLDSADSNTGSFGTSDLEIFRNNLLFETRLDWVPNNHEFNVIVTEPLNAKSTRLDIENISNISPSLQEGTQNLSVEIGDEFMSSPNTSVSNKITFIEKPDTDTDIGFAIISNPVSPAETGPTAVSVFAKSVGETIRIKKKNGANYSPSTGRFTFGKELQFFYSNDDSITKIAAKSNPNTPFDTSPVSMYPLTVSNFDLKGDGQFSFKLTGKNDSPIVFQNSPGDRVLLASSPAGLNFKPTDIMRFFRKLPVTQKDFLANIPPDFRSLGGPDKFTELQNAEAQSGSLVESGYGNIFDGFEETEFIYSNSGGVTYKTVLTSVSEDITTANHIIENSLINRTGNYFNNTQFEVNVEGALVIQDPVGVVSPAGVPLFNDCPLAPSAYLKEGTLDNPVYNRAFSTFDGPWSDSPSTDGFGRSIFTHGDSPNHAEYVSDLVVRDLVFEDLVVIEDYSDSLITSNDAANANSPVTTDLNSQGFTHKYPLIVEETDEDTGELIEVTYFLLLKQLS